MYILRPHAVGILYPPPFYTPPTPRRVFSGVGGWGCIKSGPVINVVLQLFWGVSETLCCSTAFAARYGSGSSSGFGS